MSSILENSIRGEEEEGWGKSKTTNTRTRLSVRSPLCKVERCGKISRRDGYCTKHWNEHHPTEIGLTKKMNIEKEAKIGPCLVEGCKEQAKWVRDYQKHWNEHPLEELNAAQRSRIERKRANDRKEKRRKKRICSAEGCDKYVQQDSYRIGGSITLKNSK
jgi:hypothetical protein